MKKLFVAVLALGLVACGGGSSSDKESSSQFGVPTSASILVTEISSSNDMFDDAQIVSLGTSVTGAVSENDEFDFYAFRAQENKSFLITLTGEAGKDIDITVFDSEYGFISESYEDYSEESVEYVATYTGTYYVRVEHYDGGSANYQLTLVSSNPVTIAEATFCVDSDEGGQATHQLNASSGERTDWMSGTCPVSTFVSRCKVNSNAANAEVNMYLSQEYVDTLGSHAKVESLLCDQFIDQDTTAVYSVL